MLIWLIELLRNREVQTFVDRCPRVDVALHLDELCFITLVIL